MVLAVAVQAAQGPAAGGDEVRCGQAVEALPVELRRKGPAFLLLLVPWASGADMVAPRPSRATRISAMSPVLHQLPSFLDILLTLPGKIRSAAAGRVLLHKLVGESTRDNNGSHLGLWRVVARLLGGAVFALGLPGVGVGSAVAAPPGRLALGRWP